MQTKALKNKKSDLKTYQLRRQVIALIHEAKKLAPNLPRISVRVTENHEKFCGVAHLGKCEIFITEDFVASKAVVFHEILHAAYSVGHCSSCRLMGPVVTNITDAECDKLFKIYVACALPSKGGK